MRRMEKITGRTDDMLIVRGVNVFPTQVEEQILAVEGLSPHYQIELRKQGNMDAVTVNCECLDGSVDKAAAAAELAKRIKDMIGISARINVQDAGQVARSEGKAQRVIDLRKE